MPAYYDFTKKKPAGRKVQENPSARQAATPEVIGTIQGQIPDSKEEFYCASWLSSHKFNFTYQYPVFRQGVKHGYKIDFVVWTLPLATMLELYGNFWHTQELGRDDRKRQIDIEEEMQSVAKVPMSILWAGDMINRVSVEAGLTRIFTHG